MHRIDLTTERPEPEVAAEIGLLHGEDKFNLLVEESAQVYNPRGVLVAKYLQGIVPPSLAATTYEALKEAAGETGNRGYATGIKDETGQQYSPYRIKKDGTRSKTHESRVKVNSGIVGYFERYSARFPYCRQTAWTMDNKEKFIAALPMLQLASHTFEGLVPERYAAQKAFVENTHKEWIVPGTVFTTITVNSNWQTAQHQDAGDCRFGFGVMATLGHDYEGGYLMFPKYGVAFNMRPGDLILADVHEWHCNSPIRILKEGGERLALVCYFRENMERCGTPAEELEAAKNRQTGDPTWEPEAPLFQ